MLPTLCGEQFFIEIFPLCDIIIILEVRIMYKYELHLHSSGCSKCAVSTAVQMVDAARKAGYSGVVFTNHFYYGNTCVDKSLPWKDFVDRYKNDYITAKGYAEQFDFDVLFGIEEWYEAGKEALIYGLEPEVLYDAPYMFEQDIHKISSFVRKNGGFIVAAHPFRNRPYIPEPDKVPDLTLFDALEVNNHFNNPEDNRKAALLALEHNMTGTSGGDIHNACDLGQSGLAFESRIKTGAELVKALKARKFKLIIENEII